MPERLAIYVDGFNLYHGLHDKWRRRYLWLDLAALGRAMRPRSNLVKVKYFTAPVLNEPAALSRQSAYQAALTALNPGVVEIVQGRYQTKQKRCNGCGRAWTEYEEKETDVNIAVHLVSDAALGSSDAAIIVSADSDLVPAVKAARTMNPSLFVAAAFPPARYSNELKTLMPSSFHIGAQRIKQCQLPQTVSDTRSGSSWTRPVKWR
ncbi:MAG TPA: NYN domain-containing protein [Aldersonia sp.]